MMLCISKRWVQPLCIGFPNYWKKISVTIHGLDHQRAKWGKLSSRYIISGEKNAVRFVDEIIALSQGVMNYF